MIIRNKYSVMAGCLSLALLGGMAPSVQAQDFEGEPVVEEEVVAEPQLAPEAGTEADLALDAVLEAAPVINPTRVEQRIVGLDSLGFGLASRTYSTSASHAMSIRPRVNSLIVDAELQLVLTRDPVVSLGIQGLEVLVDGQAIAVIGLEDFGGADAPHRIALGNHFVGSNHELQMRLLGVPEEMCGTVTAGAWKIIKKGQVVMELASVPHLPDLAELPLPFYDSGFDGIVTIPVSVMEAPGIDGAALGSHVAAWFGKNVGEKIRFEPSFGRIPDNNGVVLTTNDAAMQQGLPPVSGPTIQWVVHPQKTDAFLLMIAGPTEAELEVAARYFVAHGSSLSGSQVLVDAGPTEAPRAAYDAPRWQVDESGVIDLFALGTDESRQLMDLPTGTVAVEFRLPPDLDTGAQGSIPLHLSLLTAAPMEEDPRTLVVEFNGTYIGAAELSESDQGYMEADFQVPSTALRGYNRLQLHAVFPEEARCQTTPSEPGSTHWNLAVQEGSKLALGDYQRVAWMPSMAMFVDDGFPFTRSPQLAESVIVLPEQPSVEVVGTAWSLMALFASVTGADTRHARWMSPRELVVTRPDADILAVGTPSELSLLADWSAHSPLTVSGTGFTVPRVSTSRTVMGLLEGRRLDVEASRAHEVLGSASDIGLVYGFQSPWTEHRSVVVVSALNPAQLPVASDLRGHVDTTQRQGDVLVARGDMRWMMMLGDRYDSAELGSWQVLLRNLVRYWTLIIPIMLLGALCFAFAVKRGMGWREWERLQVRDPVM